MRPALKSAKQDTADEQMTLDMNEEATDTEQIDETDESSVKTTRVARKSAEPRQPKYRDDSEPR